MNANVVIKKEILETLLLSARAAHPKEIIFLLRGKSNRDVVSVSDVLIPPFATRGRGFSSFPAHMLPIDFSIMGVAHSHPSGSVKPSVEDLNHPFGKVTLIIASPYAGIENVAAYDKSGKKLTLLTV